MDELRIEPQGMPSSDPSSSAVSITSRIYCIRRVRLAKEYVMEHHREQGKMWHYLTIIIGMRGLGAK
jgi:hypothetical protein